MKNNSTHLLLNCICLCEVTIFSPCYEQHIKTKKQDKTIEEELTLLDFLVQILKDIRPIFKSVCKFLCIPEK